MSDDCSLKTMGHYLIFLEIQWLKALRMPGGFLFRDSLSLPPEVEAEERLAIARVAVGHVPAHLQAHWMGLLDQLFVAHLRLLKDFRASIEASIKERRAPGAGEAGPALHKAVLSAWREYCAVAGLMNSDPSDRLAMIVREFDPRLWPFGPEDLRASGEKRLPNYKAIDALLTKPEEVLSAISPGGNGEGPTVDKEDDRILRALDNESTSADGQPPLPPARLSDDGSSAHWYGTDYTFTYTQGACVKVLWRNWKNGTPEVRQHTILEDPGVEAESKRLVDVFKGHPAWGKMIVRGTRKGTYRLEPPT